VDFASVRAAMRAGVNAKADYPAALAHFTRALQLAGDHNSAPALDLRISLLCKRSAAALALACAGRAPREADLDFIERAVLDAKDAILLHPGVADGHGHLGEALFARFQRQPKMFSGQNDSVSARIAFERAIELVPGEARWRRGLREIPARRMVEAGGIKMDLEDVLTSLLGFSISTTRTQDHSLRAAGPGPGCSGCGKRPQTGKHLLRCAACLVTFYCGAECQRAAWKVHKPACNAAKVQREGGGGGPSGGAGST